MNQGARGALLNLAADLRETADLLAAEADVSYGVPGISVDNAEFTDQSNDWDGSEAVSSYPDPGAEDTDLSEFRSNFMFAPPSDSEAAENKSAYKGPIRESHGGRINPNALSALISAINGARGGFSGIGPDTRNAGYDKAVKLGIAAGLYDSEDDAPEYSPSSGEASDGDQDGLGPNTGFIEASEPFRGSTFSSQAAAGDDPRQTDLTDGLSGVIWATGRHTLHLNGKPTTIEVPKETIEPTYQRLKRAIAAADSKQELPKIGFDHPKSDSVAAQTPLGEIGVMKEIALSDDGEKIVLTDSEYTNSKAVEAAEAGSFDGYEFSIVGGMAAIRDDDGKPVKNDGAIRLAAARIDRTDVVPNGAIHEPIGKTPQLAASLAISSPEQPAQGFVQTLEAAKGEIHDTQEIMGDDYDFSTDPDSLEAAEGALEAAGDVIDSKDETISELKAEKAELEGDSQAFYEIAASLGIDAEDEDTGVQDVIDEFTEDLRAEIAEIEAGLPRYDTEPESVEDRTDELKGSGMQELKAKRGDLSYEVLQSDVKREEFGGAIAAGEAGGKQSPGSGGSEDEQVEELADSVLDPIEAEEAEKQGISYREKLKQETGIDAADHETEFGLLTAMAEQGSDE